MPIQGFLNDLYKGTVSSDEDGQYRGTGLGAAILKPFVDEQNIESTKQQGAVKRQITALGENPADYNLGPGATVYDAKGAVVSEQRRRASEKEDKNFERSMEIPRAQMAEVSAQNQLTNKRLDNQMEMAMLDRADAKEQRAAELEYQKMRDRKADLQYNERMDRLDRQDRRAMMQNLAAGLASLGAAFAL